ncbi:MAG: sigma-70 family RNA polymerase sigma factor [Eubacteriales bacterium]|nr:sigma-70 family RNA polymerase sigma factor [Eubacteriales bacterium]
MTREQEAAVIQAVLDGDVNAYEALVKEYEKNVYNLALRMTGNSEDAADMAQEAFIKAYNSLTAFRGDSKFSVWLYRIVSNVCLDFLRSRSRKQTVSLSTENDDGEEVELDIADETHSPEQLLDRSLTRDAVRRGLAALPPDHREILLLREIQGLSYEEIADVLGLEAGTVKSRIFRARKKLCSFLIKDGNIPEFVSSSKERGGDLS